MVRKGDIGKYSRLLTHEERVENGRKGGKQKGENYRKRREMREVIEILLSMPLDDKDIKELEDIASFKSLANKNLTVNDAIIVKQVQKALKGDLNALTFLRDTSGQKPKDDVNLDVKLPVLFEGEEELQD